MSVIAHRYAQALFSLSQESTSLKEIENEARQVLSWISNNADFNAFISNRFLTAKESQPALNTLSEKAAFSTTFSSFLFIVAEKSRLALLQSILEAFLRLVDKKSGLMRGSVTTAQKLSKGQLTKLTSSLSKKLGRKIDLVPIVDQNILGGVVLKVGAYLIDSSLETRLMRLEKRLKG